MTRIFHSASDYARAQRLPQPRFRIDELLLSGRRGPPAGRRAVPMPAPLEARKAEESLAIFRRLANANLSRTQRRSPYRIPAPKCRAPRVLRGFQRARGRSASPSRRAASLRQSRSSRGSDAGDGGEPPPSKVYAGRGEPCPPIQFRRQHHGSVHNCLSRPSLRQFRTTRSPVRIDSLGATP